MNQTIQNFLEHLAMIIVFISIRASPFSKNIDNLWIWFMIFGIVVFTYSHIIATYLYNLMPTRLHERILQKFFSNVSIIIIFIALKASPLGKYIDKGWVVWLIIGILLFVMSKNITKKL